MVLFITVIFQAFVTAVFVILLFDLYAYAQIKLIRRQAKKQAVAQIDEVLKAVSSNVIH